METKKELTLVTLNAWGGRSLHMLMRFFQKNAASADVFCLQEMFRTDTASVDARHPDEYMRGDVFDLAAKVLPDHEGFFASHPSNPHAMSLALFVRRGLLTSGPANVQVHVPKEQVLTGSAVKSPRHAQVFTLGLGGRQLLVVHYHGLWDFTKNDTPDRLKQSQNLKAVLAMHDGPKLLCGDLNLLPETQSVAILADGMRNLVKDFAVTGTRTPLYRHYADPAEPNFADYIFTDGLEVRRFEVLPDIVSDHAPLLVTVA